MKKMTNTRRQTALTHASHNIGPADRYNYLSAGPIICDAFKAIFHFKCFAEQAEEYLLFLQSDWSINFEQCSTFFLRPRSKKRP